jgi:hypothetical protein
MNRKTNAHPARGDAAVEQATALLVHSMQQSDSPISDLGDALARMAQTLNTVGAPPFTAGVGEPAGPLQSLRESLDRDIAVCIQSLQFHDRLMQQLTQARDLLTGAIPSGGYAANGLLSHPSNVSANEGSIEGTVELF